MIGFILTFEIPAFPAGLLVPSPTIEASPSIVKTNISIPAKGTGTDRQGD